MKEQKTFVLLCIHRESSCIKWGTVNHLFSVDFLLLYITHGQNVLSLLSLTLFSLGRIGCVLRPRPWQVAN